MEELKFINPIERAMDPEKRDRYLKQMEGKILIYTDKDGYISKQITVDELREKFNGDEDSFLLSAERLDSQSTDYAKGNVSWVEANFDIEKHNKDVARRK